MILSQKAKLDLPNKVPLFSGYTDVYYWNRDSDSFITVNQGGTSSSKTYSIMQNLCRLAIEQVRIIQVFGQDFPNLYVGAIADMKRLIADSPILRECLVNPNLDRGPFKFKNGSVIQFTTAQTAQDAKSGKRNILFINEANGIPYEIAFELIARTTEKVFIDYNPNARFWVHHELEGHPDVTFFISNFTHNKFLPEQIRKQILSWKERYEMTQSVYWRNKWYVYGLGLTGVVEGTVFDHVDVVNFFPMAAKHVVYGLDFGFKNNYTALVKIGYYNEAMYGKEILYEQALNSMKLAEMLENIGIDKEQKIVADPANTEAITILQDKGFNIVPAKKGNDSIKPSIELIQSMPLYLTKDSKNWLIEAENYKYKRDINGRFTNNPIDNYNDCFVAGSKVITSTGLKPIEQIKVGELVLTSNGYNKVVHTWDNGIREVSRYTLIVSGQKVVLECTDKHKIKTKKGWKQVQELQEQDIVYLSKSLGVKYSRYTQIKSIFIGTVNLFTKWFGSISKDLSLKVFMSTILTRILTTMTSETLLSKKRDSICQTMRKRGLKNTLTNFKQQVQKLLNLGTEVRKGEGGIKNTLKAQASGSKITEIGSAILVEKNTQQKIQHNVFAQTNANQKQDEIQELIQNEEPVNAVNSITVVSTQNRKVVVEGVVEKISREYIGERPVYDLMVEHTHEYFVDNLLVSNCWDAARYCYVELFGLRLRKPTDRVYKGHQRKIYIT